MSATPWISRACAVLLIAGIAGCGRTVNETVRRSLEPSWAKPYETPNTLGATLEAQFDRLLIDCAITIEDSSWGRRSAVPHALQVALDSAMMDSVRVQDRAGAARLFAYIFPSRQAAYDLALEGATRTLSVDEVHEGLESVPFNTSRVAYVQSCQTVLNAAAEGEAGLSMPVASLQSAFEASGSRETVTRLVLFWGTSQSALADAIRREAAPRNERLAAHLYVWRWWTRPTAPLDTAFYVVSYEGGSVYEISSRDETADGKIEVGGSAAAPGIASVEASLQAAMDRDQRMKVERVVTIHLLDGQGKPRMEVEPIPFPRAIADWIEANSRATLQPGLIQQAEAGADYDYWIEVAGVPRLMCDETAWEVQPVDSGPNAAAVGIDSTATKQGVCRFYLRYRVPVSLPQDGIQLRHVLVPHQKAGSVSFRIRIPAQVLATTGAPRLIPRDSHRLWTPGRTDSLVWTATYTLQDPKNTINPTQGVELIDRIMTCDGSPIPVLASAEFIEEGRAVRVTVSRAVFLEDHLDLNSTENPKTCQFSARAFFNSVTREVGLQPREFAHPTVTTKVGEQRPTG